jgi:hypothetical protein
VEAARIVTLALLSILTTFLSGTLLGVVLATIRARLRRVEEQAREVADALADTVLVDGVQLPKPDDARWEVKDVKYGEATSRSLVLGQVIVGGARVNGYDAVYLNGVALNQKKTFDEKKYVTAVWRAHYTRITLQSVR